MKAVYWNPTHVITVTKVIGDTEFSEAWEVMLADGIAYTLEEWVTSSPADWERTEEGEWWFQGRPAPTDGVVVVTKVKKD